MRYLIVLQLCVLAVVTVNFDRMAALSAELRRRTAIESGDTAEYRRARAGAERMLASIQNHPKQFAAVGETARLTADQCTRRAGKSSGWLKRMAYDAVMVPGSHQLYINTTWPECRKIAWRGANPLDGLFALNQRFNLGFIPHKGEHTFTAPYNGAVIELIPADNERQIERALGGAYHRVWIDEAQKMPHVQMLVQSVVGPAMMDFNGQIVMTGTPSRFAAGYYHDVVIEDSDFQSKDGGPGWVVHKFSVLDNPHFGDTREERFERAIMAYCREHNLDLDHPSVRRDWFNEWILEDTSFVWSLNRVGEKAYYAPMRWLGPEPKLDYSLEDLPPPDIDACLDDLPEIDGEWLHVLGLDLGFRPDPFGYVIWSFSFQHTTMYELCSWKKPGLTTNARDDVIRELRDRLPFFAISADAGPDIVAGWNETWEERFNLPIVAAQKKEKAVHVELMDGDIRDDSVMLRKGSPLAHEMKHLVHRPDLAAGKLVVHKHRKLPTGVVPGDHCLDGGLYGYRECFHYRAQVPVPKPRPGTPEYDIMIEAEVEAEVDRQTDEDDDWFDAEDLYDAV